MRLSLFYGLPFLRRDFRLRRILAVRIWLLPPIPDRMCNRIQGRTPVFGLCLLIHQMFVSDVDQMDIRIVEVELHQILVAEVELFCDPLFCGLGFHQIFGFCSGPWFEM